MPYKARTTAIGRLKVKKKNMSGCLLIQWVKHEVTLQLPCADHWSFVLRYESTRHWVEAKCMYKTNKNSKYTELFITLWSWQTKQNKENMLYDNAKHQKSPARPQGFIRPQKNNKVLNVCLMKRDKKKKISRLHSIKLPIYLNVVWTLTRCFHRYFSRNGCM